MRIYAYENIYMKKICIREYTYKGIYIYMCKAYIMEYLYI